jgi:hypothetical protein
MRPASTGRIQFTPLQHPFWVLFGTLLPVVAALWLLLFGTLPCLPFSSFEARVLQPVSLLLSVLLAVVPDFAGLAVLDFIELVVPD